MDFIYDDDYGTIEIVGYDVKNKTLKTLYNGFQTTIRTKSIREDNIKKVIGRNNFSYGIDEIVYDKKGNKRKILSRFKDEENGCKTYKCLCLICGEVQNVTESEINRKIGCGVCGNRIIKHGLNDIYTTHYDLVRYFKFEEDAKNNTYGSHNRVWLKCPVCGFEKKILIYSLVEYGFSCPKCSDGISYPNKVIANFLNSFSIQYITEYSPEWAENKRYDFFFEIRNEQYIIEAHGKQHYLGGFEKLGGRNLNEEKDNDLKKKNNALCNGFKKENYIIIDCRESNIQFIRKNINNSLLGKIFNTELINWSEIDKNSQSSLIYDVADYYNKASSNIKEIASNFNLHTGTICRYLNKANKSGLCKYNSKDILIRTLKNNHKNNSKSITMKYNDKLIGTFPSGRYIEDNSLNLFGVKLLSPQISTSAKSGKTYKGYSFEYTKI